MTEPGRELVEQSHRKALEQIRSGLSLEPADPQPFAEPDLPPATPGSPFAEEWELFRSEVGNLLADGGRGRFALVKSGQPITVWDSLRDAAQAGQLLYGAEACLIQPILPRLRSLRVG